MSSIAAEPGVPVYRDPNLTNEVACMAAINAANWITEEALRARAHLLAAGFSDAHPLCIEMDRTARQYTDVVDSVRYSQGGEA